MPLAPEHEWLELIDRLAPRLARHVAIQWELPESLRDAVTTTQLDDNATPQLKLIFAATEVIDTLEAYSVIDAESLFAKTSQLSKDECENLIALLPSIPPAVQGLALDIPHAPAQSAVKPQSEALEMRALTKGLNATAGSAGRGRPFRITRISSDYVALNGRTFLQPNALVSVTIQTSEEELSFWARVYSCQQVDKKSYNIVCHHFALNGDEQKQIEALGL